MNLWEIVFLFFAFQAVILALLFFLKKKGDRLANALLGIYLLLFSYNIFYNVLYWSKKLFTLDFLSLSYTNLLPWILYGPVLYLYVKRVIYKRKFKILDLVHFIPAIFIIVNFLPWHLMPINEKVTLLVNKEWYSLTFYHIPHEIRIKIIIALMFLYFGLTLHILKNGLTSLNQRRWLSWLIFSFLGYIITFSSYFILQYYGFVDMGYDYFIGYAMIFFIGLVSYFGFLQPEVFNGLSMDEIIPFVKYQRTGLTKSHSFELKLKLLSFMKNDKPYLNSELRLDDLAEKLNLSRHHTSQVINEHFDSSFFDFINNYRIEEAKRMLMGEENLSITDVLYSSGFNNRVSFYKAFKKFIGLTPSEYKSRQDKASGF